MYLYFSKINLQSYFRYLLLFIHNFDETTFNVNEVN